MPGKAWRVALLQVALTWISSWHRFAFKVPRDKRVGFLEDFQAAWWERLEKRHMFFLRAWGLGWVLVGMEVHGSFDDHAVHTSLHSLGSVD